MRENKQDASTRRFSTDSFDCTPPREAIDELLRPKRARIFRTSKPPRKRSRFEEIKAVGNTILFWAMGVAFIMALGAIANYLFTEKRATLAPSAPATAPAMIVRPTPAPRLRPVPAPAPALAPVQPAPPVRRAELALKRAEFVGLPVGWQGNEMMPDGSILPVRYMGEVAYFDSLPRNPSYGDMWKVTSSGATWVFCTPAGFSAPAWVDP